MFLHDYFLAFEISPVRTQTLIHHVCTHLCCSSSGAWAPCTRWVGEAEEVARLIVFFALKPKLKRRRIKKYEDAWVKKHF